jgi:hypothetical protein
MGRPMVRFFIDMAENGFLILKTGFSFLGSGVGGGGVKGSAHAIFPGKVFSLSNDKIE